MESYKVFKSGAEALSAANSALRNTAPEIHPDHDVIRHDWDPTPDAGKVEQLKADLKARLMRRFATPAATASDG